jgi:hypothetical protein
MTGDQSFYFIRGRARKGGGRVRRAPAVMTGVEVNRPNEDKFVACLNCAFSLMAMVGKAHEAAQRHVRERRLSLHRLQFYENARLKSHIRSCHFNFYLQ